MPYIFWVIELFLFVAENRECCRNLKIAENCNFMVIAKISGVYLECPCDNKGEGAQKKTLKERDAKRKSHTQRKRERYFFLNCRLWLNASCTIVKYYFFSSSVALLPGTIPSRSHNFVNQSYHIVLHDITKYYIISFHITLHYITSFQIISL